MSTPVENAGSAAIDTYEILICMSHNGEATYNRNTDEFNRNFDEVKFPKRKGASADEKEKRRKDFLRRILLDDDGDYPELEEDVEKSYERCKGLEY